MTTTMLEKIARAIQADIGRQFNATTPAPGLPDDGSSWTATGGEVDCVRVARAALLALREPDEGMLAAGVLINTMAEYCFTAMIDHALNEETK